MYKGNSFKKTFWGSYCSLSWILSHPIMRPLDFLVFGPNIVSSLLSLSHTCILRELDIMLLNEHGLAWMISYLIVFVMLVVCLFVLCLFSLCDWMPWVDVLFYLVGWNWDIKSTFRLLHLPWSLVVTPIPWTSRYIIWDSGKFTKPSHYVFIVYIVSCSWFWHIEGNVHL